MVWPIMGRYETLGYHLRGTEDASQQVGPTLSAQNENVCRRKMRMSGLCKVEMSAFIDGRGPYGNGANHLEPTRTGPIESVARGEAEASFAGSSSGAVEGNRPPGAANAAADSRTWGWCPGSRTAGQAIEPQGSSAVGAEDSGAPTPALCGFRTHAGRRTPGQGRSLGES